MGQSEVANFPPGRRLALVSTLDPLARSQHDKGMHSLLAATVSSTRAQQRQGTLKLDEPIPRNLRSCDNVLQRDASTRRTWLSLVLVRNLTESQSQPLGCNCSEREGIAHEHSTRCCSTR